MVAALNAAVGAAAQSFWLEQAVSMPPQLQLWASLPELVLHHQVVVPLVGRSRCCPEHTSLHLGFVLLERADDLQGPKSSALSPQAMANLELTMATTLWHAIMMLNSIACFL